MVICILCVFSKYKGGEDIGEMRVENVFFFICFLVFREERGNKNLIYFNGFNFVFFNKLVNKLFF